MRNYLYVSDAKVDMLLPQVPGGLKKTLAAKLGIDVKVLTASVTAESVTNENRIARLEAVERHIAAEADVGDPDSSAPWIQGSISSKFVRLGYGGIVFVSWIDRFILGLGGSAKHLIGGQEPAKADIPQWSFLPDLIRGLVILTEHLPQFEIQSDEAAMTNWLDNGSANFAAWMDVLKNTYIATPDVVEMDIEFMAKRLKSDKTHWGENVTLATPLFVAQADLL